MTLPRNNTNNHITNFHYKFQEESSTTLLYPGDVTMLSSLSDTPQLLTSWVENWVETAYIVIKKLS